MWLGACTSQIGTFVQQFAQSWLVYDMTKDPFYLGLDLFLGQTADHDVFAGGRGVRGPHRPAQAAAGLAIHPDDLRVYSDGAVLLLTPVKVWHILTLSFIVGCGQSMGGPAYSALLPSLVNPKDLSNAIAMNSIQFNLARIVGPDHRRAGLHGTGRHLVLRR